MSGMAANTTAAAAVSAAGAGNPLLAAQYATAYTQVSSHTLSQALQASAALTFNKVSLSI